MNIRKTTRNLVANALLCGITILLGFTPLGMIPLPILSPTTVHIPALIAAIYLGYKNGLVVALCFGLVSLTRAIQQPIGLTVFFMNPLIAILPRLSIPLTAYYSYKLFQKITKKDFTAISLAAFSGSLSNTVFTLGSIQLFYGEQLTQIVNNAIQTGATSAEYMNNASTYLLSAIAIPYGLSESIVSAVIVPIIIVTLKKAIRN